MIPKIIHYCWFGDCEIPDHDRKCIESWKRFCPDYEIIRWAAHNYHVPKIRYMHEAYEAKKWGFVPDYARLDIVYEHGGVYLDTDVELIRNIDDLLENKAFMGFEQDGLFVSPGLGFGAEKHMPLLRETMDSIYSSRVFKLGPNEYDTTPSPIMNVEFLERKGLKKNNQFQIIDGMTIYPSEYFCPIDYATGIMTVTEATFSIHHYHASWLEPEERIIVRNTQRLVLKYGNRVGNNLAAIASKPYRLKMHLRTKGVGGTAKFAAQKMKKCLFCRNTSRDKT